MTLAHGPGDGIDLPIPAWMAMVACMVAIVATFTFLTVAGRQPFGREHRGLPASFSGPASRIILQAIGLSGLSVVLMTAWFGPATTNQNPAPTWLYVWFWIGLTAISLVLGDIYQHLNPLRTIGTLLHLLVGRDREVPVRLNLLAVGGIWIFLWLELVAPAGHAPRTVAAFVTGYALFHVIGGAWFGPRWFDRCDGFGVYFALVARLSPFGRRDDEEPVLRGTCVAIILTILAANIFDGMSHLEFWRQLSIDANYSGRSHDPVILGTAGLTGALVAICLFYLATIHATRRFVKPESTADTSGIYASCLIPITVGYAVAYYFPVAVFDGQVGYLLPLEGTSSIDYTVVSTTMVAWVQFAALTFGHVKAVIAMYARSTSVLRPRLLAVGQIPMLGLVLASGMAGVALL